MSADLLISLAGSCAVAETHGLQDGVFAVFFADGQHGVLHPPFARTRGLFLAPSRERRFVGKQIELNVFRLGLHVPLPLHMVRDDLHPAHEQPAVHDPVKQHRQRLQELSGGGGRRPERF